MAVRKSGCGIGLGDATYALALAVVAVLQGNLDFPDEVIGPTRSQFYTATVSVDTMGKIASYDKLPRKGKGGEVERALIQPGAMIVNDTTVQGIKLV